MNYNEYTDKELMNALYQIEKLIYVLQGLSHEMCDINKQAYDLLLNEIQKRGIYDGIKSKTN